MGKHAVPNMARVSTALEFGSLHYSIDDRALFEDLELRLPVGSPSRSWAPAAAGRAPSSPAPWAW